MVYQQKIKKVHYVEEPYGLPLELQEKDKFIVADESYYDLQPRYDSRKNFYGKAKVTEKGNKKVLTSYSTDVAEIENGNAKVHGLYSATTTRHIKEFLKQNGFKADNSKQIMKDYGDKN
jgi:hypothetical protein